MRLHEVEERRQGAVLGTDDDGELVVGTDTDVVDARGEHGLSGSEVLEIGDVFGGGAGARHQRCQRNQIYYSFFHTELGLQAARPQIPNNDLRARSQ